jgi:hypothetical protein
MNRQYIIAGNRDEYGAWRIKNQIYQGCVYVSGLDSLRGTHQPHGKLIGTWYNRPDIFHILNQLMVARSITGDQYEDILVTRNLILKLSPDLSMYE